MDCRRTLVRTYLFVCRRYRAHVRAASQRQSNNSDPDFTDKEVLTVYLFGIAEQCKTVSEIHRYVAEHFAAWFPDLPSYQSYNRRLNRLSAAFAPLLEEVLAAIDRGQAGGGDLTRIADSMPIMLAKEKRSGRAKVAPDLAEKGYCSSKGTFYYGVKLHAIAERRPGKLPVVERAGLTPANEHDLVALRRVLPFIEGGRLFADKAYCDSSMKERVARKQNLDVLTPIKKKKGQKRISAAGELFSAAVSKVRQPIESLFNWVNEKTGIQRASKVRSRKGLFVHVFGRLAAAMLMLAFNP